MAASMLALRTEAALSSTGARACGVVRGVDQHHLGARAERRLELVPRHAPVAVVELYQLHLAASAAAHARVAVVLGVEDDYLLVSQSN